MLDLSLPSNISVLIDGVECHQNIEPGSALEWSLRDLEKPEPLVQIGDLTLALPDKVGGNALDINPATSSTLAIGNRVQFFWGGSIKATARIKQVEIVDFFPCTTTPSRVKVFLTDKLDIALGVEAKSSPPVETGATVAFAGGSLNISSWFSRVAQLISNVRDLNGDRIFEREDIITDNLSANLPGSFDLTGNPVPDGFSSDSSTEASLVAKAAKIAALRGWYLFCDEEEKVRFIRNPDSTDMPSPVLRADCASVEISPVLEPLVEPASSVEVTSTALEVIVNKIEWPKCIETIGPIPFFPNPDAIQPVVVSGPNLPRAAGTIGTIEKEIRNRPVIGSNSWLQVTSLKKRKYLVNPELTDTALVTVRLTFLSKQFKNRYLERLTETNRESRTLQDPAVFEDDFTVVSGSNKIIEYDLKTSDIGGEPRTYFERSTERLLRRKYEKDNNGVTTSNLMEERLITEWTELGRNSWRGRKRRYVSRGLVEGNLDYSLIPDPNFNAQEEFAEAPPEPPVREPDEEVALRSSTTVSKIGASGLGRRKYVFLAGQSDPTALARYGDNHLLAEQQYRIQMDVIRQTFDTDALTPLQREDIHDYALVRDGVRVEWGDRSLSFKYTGYPIAKLTPPVTPIYPPPYNFTSPPAGLTIGPYAALTTTPGAQVTLPLAAYGGVLPYGFSLVGAPGPGVLISGNMLLVGGLDAGSYSFALQVTDNNGTTASTSITVEVVADTAAVLYTLPPQEIIDSNGTTDTFSITETLLPFEDLNGTKESVLAAIAIPLSDENGSEETVLLATTAIDLNGSTDSFVLELPEGGCFEVTAGGEGVTADGDDVAVDTTLVEVTAGEDTVTAGPDDVIIDTGLSEVTAGPDSVTAGPDDVAIDTGC